MNEKTLDELPVPSNVLDAEKAIEVIRLWMVSNGGETNQTLTVRTAWKDPAAWGLALVDLAHHIAEAYGNEGTFSAEEALRRIKQACDVEWAFPTDD